MPKQPRPYIGVNADLIPGNKRSLAGIRLALGYVDAIAAAGGLPVIVPPFQREIDLDAYLDQLDGFVLTGAEGDLDPRRHGLSTHPAVQLLPERRDDSDRNLVRKLLARRMPVLGIGLGMQQLNVACGGTLYLHLPGELPRGLPHRDPSGPAHRHTAMIRSGTRLEEIYGPGEICINSCHHQAVRQLGQGFQAGAVAPDGVVEAIEYIDDDWFCLGVQWHPEAESATALDLQLFECLVQACLREAPVLRQSA
ncbi:MAG: gamma-glutamyl-gamma-aminobutyrate hydrolase family protein [Gemmataceae bacterium]